MPNDPNYGDLHNPEKYVTSAKRFNKIAFLTYLIGLALIVTLFASNAFRGSPEYHSFEEASGDISNLIEYHFWKTGQVAAGMKDLAPYVQAGHISYKIDFRVDWQIETAKDLSAATFAFVNYTFSKLLRHQPHTIVTSSTSQTTIVPRKSEKLHQLRVDSVAPARDFNSIRPKVQLRIRPAAAKRVGPNPFGPGLLLSIRR